MKTNRLFVLLIAAQFHFATPIFASDPSDRNHITRDDLYVEMIGNPVAENVQFVRKALDAGISVNCRFDDAQGTTLLIHAAGFGHAGIVKLLLTRGANVNAQSLHGGQTALWETANADLDEVNLGLTTITPAVSKKRQQYDQCYVEIIRLLLQCHANPNIADENGVTPLGVACFRGRLTEVQAILDAPVDLDHRDNFGKTPIEWAAYNGYPQIVTLLRAHGARIDASKALPTVKQRQLDKSLYMAICNHDVAAVNRLLSEGADANASVEEGDLADHMEMQGLTTPLLTSVDSPLITSVLISKGADVNKSDDFRRTPLMSAAPEVIPLLLNHGARVDARDASGETALMKSRSEPGLKLLIAHGADINGRDSKGRTPLMNAADQTWGEGDAAACDDSWTEILLRQGAKVDLRDPDGNTALMLLAAQGEYGYYNRGNPMRVARLLVKASANLTLKNKQGINVWQIAKHSGARSLLRQLHR